MPFSRSISDNASMNSMLMYLDNSSYCENNHVTLRIRSFVTFDRLENYGQPSGGHFIVRDGMFTASDTIIDSRTIESV